MDLKSLCKLNDIVSKIDSEEDIKKNLKEINIIFKHNDDHPIYIKYFKHVETDAEVVVINDDLNNIKHFVFKGTDSKKDWQTNFDFIPIEIVVGGIKKYKIHRGFYEQWRGLSTWLKNEILKDGLLYSKNPKKLVISGHSLGGALAIICSIYMYCISNSLVQKVCTFGAPRVVCKGLTEWYNERLKCKTIRVINYFDIIPKLPLPGPLFEFCHVDSKNVFEFKYKGYYLISDKPYSNESTIENVLFYCQKFTGFFKGLMMRSEPHSLSTYLENMDSFSFFNDFPIY